MNNKVIILTLSFLSFLLMGCPPPPISIYMLEETDVEPHHWVHLSTGYVHSIADIYTINSLSTRLASSHSVDIYFYDKSYITSSDVSLTDDTLYYKCKDETISILQDSVRQLIIYDNSSVVRALERAGYVGGVMAGFALLAYLPKNPDNEPRESALLIMTGSGALLGVAIGDVATQREIIAFVKDSEIDRRW